MRCTAETQDAMDVKTSMGIQEINGRKILPGLGQTEALPMALEIPQLLTSKHKGSSCSAKHPGYTSLTRPASLIP